jgi:hypothetical protein
VLAHGVTDGDPRRRYAEKRQQPSKMPRQRRRHLRNAAQDNTKADNWKAARVDACGLAVSLVEQSPKLSRLSLQCPIEFCDGGLSVRYIFAELPSHAAKPVVDIDDVLT